MFKTLRDMSGENTIDAGQLRSTKVLGMGAFATVEKAVFTPTEGAAYEVAVKRLKPEVITSIVDVDSFKTEIALLRKLQHK